MCPGSTHAWGGRLAGVTGVPKTTAASTSTSTNGSKSTALPTRLFLRTSSQGFVLQGPLGKQGQTHNSPAKFTTLWETLSAQIGAHGDDLELTIVVTPCHRIFGQDLCDAVRHGRARRLAHIQAYLGTSNVSEHEMEGLLTCGLERLVVRIESVKNAHTRENSNETPLTEVEKVLGLLTRRRELDDVGFQTPLMECQIVTLPEGETDESSLIVRLLEAGANNVIVSTESLATANASDEPIICILPSGETFVQLDDGWGRLGSIVEQPLAEIWQGYLSDPQSVRDDRIVRKPVSELVERIGSSLATEAKSSRKTEVPPVR